MIVLGTKFGTDEFVHVADRIAKLVAHDIYLYGRGDVEVLTDLEFHERSSVQEQTLSQTNLILIGDVHQNTVTKLVLSQRAEEGTILSSALNCIIDQKSTCPW